MTAAEAHALSLAQLETLQPATINWNGADYPCQAGSAHRRKRNSPGGFALDADLVLYVRAELFAAEDLAILKAGTKNVLAYDGRNWRILEAVTPFGSPFVKLMCEDPSQGS